jgi:glycosyltransferase involved in cell wall biosynthesis
VILMPFHRQFCYADFYQQVYETQGGVRADFYHAHDLNTLPLAFAMARRHGAKLVYDSHELYLDRNRFRPLSFFGRLFVQRIEAFLIRRCDGVITVNESIAEILRDRYSIPLPTVVMNTPFRCDSSIDPGSRSLRSCLPIRSDHRILLYSGGITFNRGLDKLIRSLVLLPDCHLIMMGYGAEAFVQELAELAEHEKVADRLSFFGPVPSEEVSLYAASADLGVAPIENACLSYYYCSPNKLFEYIHAGLPVIASNFPEMCRVIDRHQIGEAFDPSDPADIARSVKKILDQPEKLPRLRENSRQAAAFYNWEIESKRLLKLYRDLLGPSQAAPRLALLAQRSSSPAEPHPRPSQLTGPHTLPAPAPPAPGRRVG